VDTTRSRLRRLLARADGFTLSVVVLTAAYGVLGWTPSSYGVQLARIGLPGAGLVAGEPREIREDEWVRWTSFVRVAVNNRFQRFNATSPYGEDLRNVEGLPLADWGLLFKPYHWPFFVVDAAPAFSFYHAFWIAAFLIGYHHVFRRFELPRSLAALASVTLFFSSFVQLWWTTYGPVMAGFPWVLIALAMPASNPRMGAVKAAASAYAMTSWALANLYPPIMITLGFVAVVTIVAFRPEVLRPHDSLFGVLGVALGAGLVFLYYRDVFFVMAATIYPGQRLAGEGGVVPGVQWFAHLFPSLVTDGFRNMVNDNVCEASTVGTFVPLLALCFCDLRALGAGISAVAWHRLRWRLTVLGCGVALTSVWLLVPLPDALGLPLLWHRVPPFRMWFACGLLILVLGMTVLLALPIRLTWPRFSIFALAVLASFWAAQALPGTTLRGWEDFGILLPLGAVLALRSRIGSAGRGAVVACAAVANLAAFGTYNPIQSAEPIFHPPATPVTAALDRLVERHPKGWLVLDGGYGAWLNGMGYKSVAHVLYAPELEFFRAVFPDIPAEEFEFLFNRTAYILVWPGNTARLSGCCEVTVPMAPFEPPSIPVEVAESLESDYEDGGREEFRGIGLDPAGAHLTILGWGMFDASGPEARLRVRTGLPVREVRAYPSLRHDVVARTGDPGLAMSGFTLVLDLDVEAIEELGGIFGEGPGRRASPHRTPQEPDAGDVEQALQEVARRPICIVTVDPERGVHALSTSECSVRAASAEVAE